MAIKESCTWLCNHGYCSSTSCRVGDGFYAKCSGKVLLDGGSVEVVLVVSGSRHDEEAVGKAGAVLDTSDDLPCPLVRTPTYRCQNRSHGGGQTDSNGSSNQ